MDIQNAKYLENGFISADIDGVEYTIPAVTTNRFYNEIIEQGVTIADYSPPAPTAAEVRVEASRRMVLLFGARDAAHLDILVSNATREAVKLLRKGPENWDATEATRAAELEGAENALDNIRAKSNLLEVMNPIPQKYTDDSYWT